VILKRQEDFLQGAIGPLKFLARLLQGISIMSLEVEKKGLVLG
jgi:hypothetical protein